jgi:outer membrane protein assembly factor BamD (BamD/ComL family)
MLELKARLNSYQGTSYDDEPLVKADKLMKQIVQQFPQQAREEKEYLAQEAGRIRHLLAERDWQLAKYFERQGENQAANIYYHQVAENFDDTQFAKLVPDEVARLADLPAKPKQHAQWLIDLFPETDNVKPLIAANPGSLLR